VAHSRVEVEDALDGGVAVVVEGVAAVVEGVAGRVGGEVETEAAPAFEEKELSVSVNDATRAAQEEEVADDVQGGVVVEGRRGVGAAAAAEDGLDDLVGEHPRLCAVIVQEGSEYFFRTAPEAHVSVCEVDRRFEEDNAERELRQAEEFQGESKFEHWETAVVKLEVSEVDSAGSSIADKAEDLPVVEIEAPEASIEGAKGAESTPEVVSVEGTVAAAPIVQVIVHALAVYARSEKEAGVGQKTWKSLRKVTLELSGFISLCHHKDAPVVNGLFKAASVNIGLDIWLVESWDLSEAVKKTTGDENKDVKLKISEEGAPPGGDTEDAPVVSIGSIEDSAVGEPVSGSPQEKAEDSEHAGGVTEAPSEVVDVSPETPAEGSVENDVPVEATKSAEPDEGSRSLEAVPFDDVEAESGMS
jgi:hypothetical protein